MSDDTHHESSLVENIAGPSLSSAMTTPTRSETSAWLPLATLVACGCAHPSTRSSAMSDQTRDENKRNVEKLFDNCFNQGDLGRARPAGGARVRRPAGRQRPGRFPGIVVGLRTAFPDIHYTLDDVIAEGDRVAVRWHWTGTHKAPFRAFPPTGKRLTNPASGSSGSRTARSSPRRWRPIASASWCRWARCRRHRAWPPPRARDEMTCAAVSARGRAFGGSARASCPTSA